MVAPERPAAAPGRPAQAALPGRPPPWLLDEEEPVELFLAVFAARVDSLHGSWPAPPFAKDMLGPAGSLKGARRRRAE